MTLEIEAGKFYRTRDGRKVGPMKPSGNKNWPWIEICGDGRCWHHDGREVEKTGSVDLIAEWPDDQPAPAEVRVRCTRREFCGNSEFGDCIKRADGSIDWATWKDAE